MGKGLLSKSSGVQGQISGVNWKIFGFIHCTHGQSPSFFAKSLAEYMIHRDIISVPSVDECPDSEVKPKIRKA